MSGITPKKGMLCGSWQIEKLCVCASMSWMCLEFKTQRRSTSKRELVEQALTLRHSDIAGTWPINFPGQVSVYHTHPIGRLAPASACSFMPTNAVLCETRLHGVSASV